MTWLLVALLFALDVGFVLGCLWNGRAYDRGYRDAREETPSVAYEPPADRPGGTGHEETGALPWIRR